MKDTKMHAARVVLTRNHRPNRAERGSALVEASLIFVLGISLLIGLFDVGQMMFVHQTVMERTREAARWATVNPFDSTKVTNMVLYGTPAAGTAGTELFNMSSSNVAVSHSGSGTMNDNISLTVSGYTYLLFSSAIVNMFWSRGGSTSISAQHTGLSVTYTIPCEYDEWAPTS
jgi:hypothetical protein